MRKKIPGAPAAASVRKPTFFPVSLGCPKNLVDSEVLSGKLLTAGYMITFDPDDADVYLINTCAFLPEARSEAAQEIGRAAQWKAEKAGRRIAVAGCLVEYDRMNSIRKSFPDVDVWIPVDDYADPAKLFAAAPEKKDAAKRSGKAAPCYLCDEKEPRLQLTVPHIAYLKICDGCNNCCTYCAIPKLRGKLRSRSIASCVAEAKTLIGNGVKELVVIAQDVTAFGMDNDRGEDLPGLLKALMAIPGDFRIRLLYTHPAHISDELIDLLAAGGKLIPYVDIPLQHVSPRILKAMNRHVTRERIIEVLTVLRERVPELILRTTFITGFPGETEKEFQELADFAKKFRFERLGVFPYSAEAGTPAAKLPDQVPAAVSEQRAAALMKSQRARLGQYYRKLVGTEMKVIVDEADDFGAWVRGALDAPDIDGAIYIPGASRVHPGEFKSIRITAAGGGNLIGEWWKGKKK